VDVFPPAGEPRAALDELEVLGSVPLDPATAADGDRGIPVAVGRPESAVAAVFAEMAGRVAERLGA
jgi:hypothetical protein